MARWGPAWKRAGPLLFFLMVKSNYMSPKILYEDSDVVVINKPAGMLVHGIYHKGEARHNEETLVDWLSRKYPEIKTVGDVPSQRGGIVHRLDRETSGVMITARNQEAFEYLKKLFSAPSKIHSPFLKGSGPEGRGISGNPPADKPATSFTKGGIGREIRKTYLALVRGHMKNQTGIIDKPISIISGSVKRTVFKGKMRREAITEYQVLQRLKSKVNSEEFTLLEVRPRTGRTHQIRVHLASLGHPVVGDKLYGKRGTLPGPDRQFLHAEKLEIMLPSGKRVAISAPLPAELQKILAGLTGQ